MLTLRCFLAQTAGAPAADAGVAESPHDDPFAAMGALFPYSVCAASVSCTYSRVACVNCVATEALGMSVQALAEGGDAAPAGEGKQEEYESFLSSF